MWRPGSALLLLALTACTTSQLVSAQRLLGKAPTGIAEAYTRLDINAVREDIKAALTTSQEFWPADFGNYGPLMIRLAWHCAGSYRRWDGRGGCDGAHIRFDPELNWPDNTNLDKAQRVLLPIKVKYGDDLSWGDLIALAGDAAVQQMGGPTLGFCGGRVDSAAGIDALQLGPTPEQELVAPCPEEGNCPEPLGPTTVGLIYVNPVGPMGVPDPVLTVATVRKTFERMGMNDSEAVALLGAHAFGKMHGACPSGAGPGPREQPANPWPGTCGSGPLMGRGPNTFTSGLDGPWTTSPTTWDNEYFKNLLEYTWELYTGPGNAQQWRPKNITGTESPVVMNTADIALLKDPEYLKYVNLFATDLDALGKAFAAAWYKLVTRDMGPVTRCLGPDVPPAQPFQNPLPPPPARLPDFDAVKEEIKAAITTAHAELPGDTMPGGGVTYAPLYATLAWRCASSFRITDYYGGCNGAHIRFPPMANFPENRLVRPILATLEPIKTKYADSLTYADLIVLAGYAAIEAAGGPELPFCGNRSDALDGGNTEFLAPRNYSNPTVEVKDTMLILGLTAREMVALAGGLRSPSQQKALGYSGSWNDADPSKLDNSYYTILLKHTWTNTTSAAGKAEAKSEDGMFYMMPTDLVYRFDPVFSAIVVEFAGSNDAFITEFSSAYVKLMNADRYDGPERNLCSSSGGAATAGV